MYEIKPLFLLPQSKDFGKSQHFSQPILEVGNPEAKRFISLTFALTTPRPFSFLLRLNCTKDAFQGKCLTQEHCVIDYLMNCLLKSTSRILDIAGSKLPTPGIVKPTSVRSFGPGIRANPASFSEHTLDGPALPRPTSKMPTFFRSLIHPKLLFEPRFNNSCEYS